MAWIEPITWTDETFINAADHMNPEIRDHFLEIWKYTQKGGLLIAKSATEIDELAPGANGEVLICDSAEELGYRWGTDGILPIGGIIIWKGNVASIPSGFVLCNGANGTPDLRGRFVIGAGGTYSVNATGGAATINIAHTHTVPYTSTAPAHTHAVISGTIGSDGAHIHTISANSSTVDYSHSHTIDTDTSTGTSAVTIHEGTGNTTSISLSSHIHHIDSLTSDATISHYHTIGGSTSSNGAHTHTISVTTGEGGSHYHTNSNTGSALSSSQSVLPPYYALCYIMRIS
jgi:hypothetical protein